MVDYKRLFLRHMDEIGIKYQDRDEFCVKVVYSGDNLNTIPIYFFFDKDGENMVALKCWDILNFNGKEANGVLACNELNAKYRWIKFFIDKDNDTVADCDAYLDDVSCGEECVRLLRRMVNIVDDAYPELAKARWS